MMRFKLLLIFASAFLTSAVKAQKTYVPDDNFEQKLIDLGYDNILDDSVLIANIDTVTILDLQQLLIEDLTGIENFTSLKGLTCYHNNITTIDLSNNLNLRFFGLSYSDLTDIDLSNNTQLDGLGLDATDLIHLNLSNNINLKNISLQNNHDLISVNLANNHNDSLEVVYVTDSPALICVQVDDTTNLDSDVWLVPQPMLLPHPILSEDCENIIGLEEEIGNSFELFPNPTSNLITVELEESVSYKIYSILGKEVLLSGVLQKGNKTLDLADLDNGMYTIQMTNEHGLTTTKKIIKQ